MLHYMWFVNVILLSIVSSTNVIHPATTISKNRNTRAAKTSEFSDE